MFQVWRNKATGDYLRYKCIKYDVEYRPGDTVFMESQRPDQPFYIWEEKRERERDVLEL